MGLIHSPSIVSDGLVLALDAQNSRSYGGSGTTWTDVSYNGNNGTLTNGPTFEPGGPFAGSTGGSVYFDGTGDYLTITNSTDHNPGTGDFTIEGWFKTSATVSYQTIISKYGAPTSYNGWYISLDSAGTGFYVSLSDGSSSSLVLTGGSNLNNGAWHHFAVSRSGTSLKLFIDGTSVATATNSFNITSTADLRISGYPTVSRDWNGQLSNIRIVKGTALYTSNFTPPTKPLTPVSGTSLLTCQGGAIVDNSSNKFSITKNGDARAIQSASIKFDGVNDGVTIPDNENFEIGTASSFECWININTVTTDRLLFGKGGTWWFSVGYTTLGGTSGEFNWLAYDGSSWTTLNTGVTVSANTWYHLVTTWDGTYFRFYANGNLEATSSDLSAKTWSNTTNAVDIGGFVSALQQMTNQKLSVAKIYTKTLTAAEVSQNFNALRGRFGV